MNAYQIPTATLQALLDYLITRPFGEVINLINALQQSIAEQNKAAAQPPQQ